MTITLEMILTHFFRNCPQRHKTDYPCSDRAISGIQLLPNHTKNLSPEFLYVTDTCPQDLPVKTPKDIYILCFSNTDDSPDETYLQFSPDRILLITDMELAVYCAMLYTGDYSRSYSEQIFRIFCDNVQSLLEKQHVDFLRNRSVTDYFLMDLLDNPNTPKKQIQERLTYNDLDYEGNFIVITIHSDIRQKPSENYFIQILRNNMINCRIFPYKQRIVILYHLPKFREANYKNYLTSQLTPILKDFSTQKLNLYFSRPFTTIGQFAAAYTQAENVCRLLRDNPKNMFSFYEEYCSLLNC